MNDADTESPELKQAVRQLMVRMRVLLQRMRADSGVPLDRGSVRDISTLVKDHRRECRSRGIAFPELVPLVLTGVGKIEFVRKDLERQHLQMHVNALAKKYPGVTPQEIAQAIVWAFPWYRGDGGLDLSRAAVKMPVNGHGANQ